MPAEADVVDLVGADVAGEEGSPPAVTPIQEVSDISSSIGLSLSGSQSPLLCDRRSGSASLWGSIFPVK